jgi:hypothetical protein
MEWHQSRERRSKKKGEPFALSVEEVSDLQQEGIQFYHRYISFFQLGDYVSVIRDTERNLEMFRFVAKHAGEEMTQSVEQFTPYVLMMNTRARASIEIEQEAFAAAAKQIEAGMEKIRAFYAERDPEAAENSPELSFLGEWLEEVRAKQPVSKLERMQREMDKAIAAEAYERAAELRDQIHALTHKRG